MSIPMSESDLAAAGLRPVEVIFNLLSICRKQAGEDLHSISRKFQSRKLLTGGDPQGKSANLPRITFWIRLCRAASLLSDDPTPYPTLLVEEWLGWPALRKIKHLLKAWVEAPSGQAYRNIRKELLRRLLQAEELSNFHRKELLGLQALEICDKETLSEWGKIILSETFSTHCLIETRQPWSMEGRHLVIPFPPDWKLLWDLEEFLDPTSPGVYALDAKTLRLAIQRGALEKSPSLVDILSMGLGARPPEEISSLLNEIPQIRIYPGYVLEFSHVDDLKTLRRSPAMRKVLDHLLSQRHVLLNPNEAEPVIRRLMRKGVLCSADWNSSSIMDDQHSDPGRMLSEADRSYLLALAILARKLLPSFPPPHNLIDRISRSIPPRLCASIANKAEQLQSQIEGESYESHDEKYPGISSQELLPLIQAAIDREEAIQVRYQASYQNQPEQRMLTPILIESRSGRSYLIAFCHKRRALRTFRLDRLELIHDEDLDTDR